MKIYTILCGLAVSSVALSGAAARSRSDTGGGVPSLDVRRSCADAEKFSISGNDKNTAFKGCMQDETSAKDTLVRTWSKFKSLDRQLCIAEAGEPSPSYVEVLTCLEMSSGQMSTSGSHTSATPPIGGAVAPGLPSVAPAMR